MTQPKQSRRYGVQTMADIKARCFVEEHSNCWIWRQAFAKGDRSNTPVCWSPEAGRVVSVLRLFAFLDSGDEAYIATGNQSLRAWRTCLNPACVRHVRYGTAEQWGEWTAKNGHRKGSLRCIAANTRTKRDASRLTMADVRVIRQSEETGVAMADRFGISVSQVSRIRLNKCWREAAHGASVFHWHGQIAVNTERAAA